MRAADPAAARARDWNALGAAPFDLLVIGGGITGCGVAREAAMRGWRVALVEKDDFASGTSSRSSRLVHGGIRYLEHGELGLVFEASRERRILARTAPHLVRPQAFLWPVYEKARVPGWKLRAGLALYDALSLFRNFGRSQWLDPDRVAEREPALRQHGLVAGAVYYDAATDDSRLTIATVRAAAAHGAVVLNHAAVTAIAPDDGTGRAVTVTEAHTGATTVARARLVVNATGPWSDAVSRMAGAAVARSAVRASRGAHILVPRARVGNTGALTLLSPIDGRVLFVLPAGPAGAHALVGTTETEHAGSPDDVRASRDEVQYLLRTVNALFPNARLGVGDVISAWAGIRPLAAQGNGSGPADAGAVSREHHIALVAPGVVAVTGGKLTTYRAMAAEIVAFAAKQLGRAAERPAPTDVTPLPGGDLPDELDAEVARAATVVRDDAVARHLVRTYGSEWRAVWALADADPALRERLADGLPYLAAEARHAAEREMALTLGDVLIRRLHLAFETPDHGLAVAPRVAAIMGHVLGWDVARQEEEVARYRNEVVELDAAG